MTRDETFPAVPCPPTHPLGHRAVPFTDEQLTAYHRTGELPPPSAYVKQAQAEIMAAGKILPPPEPGDTFTAGKHEFTAADGGDGWLHWQRRALPAVPEWVADPARWQTLSRAERRALERHHRREMRRG